MTANLLAAIAGALLSFALPPDGFSPLLLALVVPFALTARAAHARDAFWVGAAFALGFFTLYLAWLPLSFSSPALLGPAFWALHPLLLVILAIMWGATTALVRALAGPGSGSLWLLPPAWVLVELMRASGYFAFPWGTLGYAWMDTPLAQLADFVGVHGLSLITTCAAALLAAPWVPALRRPLALAPARARRRTWVAPLLAVVLLAGSAALGAWNATLHDIPTSHSALLVQGNIDPLGRAVSAAEEFTVHNTLTAQAAAAGAPPDLVVWPEGALTAYDLEGFLGDALRAELQASAPESAFVVGGRARTGDGSSNAAYAIADGAIVDRYDKHVLVPFGERWPLSETLPWLYREVFAILGLPLLANTTPGPGPKPLATPLGPVAVGVCYESVFPNISASMVRDGAGALVIITNDAWFARGDGARQHLDMGRMRAIETRRWLLRAGNDGITAVVDGNGRVRAELERMVAGSLRVEFGFSDRVTFYAAHEARVPWVILFLSLTGVFVARRPRR